MPSYDLMDKPVPLALRPTEVMRRYPHPSRPPASRVLRTLVILVLATVAIGIVTADSAPKTAVPRRRAPLPVPHVDVLR